LVHALDLRGGVAFAREEISRAADDEAGEDACREIREHENIDTKRIGQDPAIRLTVYQLAHLFGVAGADARSGG
jgi:hypothetical protein